MKTSLIVVLFFICSQLLSQIDGQNKINPSSILQERINYDSNLLEQIKHPIEPANFQNEESKRIINKTFLDNGFLILEIIIQVWDSTNWLNMLKYSYSYMPITEVASDKDYNITYKLSNNYPNPFNPTTMISYSIPELGNVELKIFDVLGREVATLINKELSQGNYEIKFDATNLTSGIYFYRIIVFPAEGKTSGFVDTKKMLLIR